MALEKTWQTSFNDLLISDVTNQDRGRHQLFWYKDALTRGSFTGKWTVVGSSDSVVGAMDGVDRWTTTFTPSKLVWNNNGSAHSWIVLQSPAALGPVWLVLAYDKAGFWEQASWYLSYTLPTGGSNLQNPTISTPGETWASLPLDAQAANSKMHIAIASDGSFKVFISRDLANAFSGFGMVGTLTELRTGDANAVVAKAVFNTSGSALGYAVFDDFRGRAPDGTAITMNAIIPAHGSARADVLAGMNQDTTEAKYLDWPIYMFVTTPAKRSVKGRLIDARIVIGGLAHGTVEPSTNPPEKTVVGPLWMPCFQEPILLAMAVHVDLLSIFPSGPGTVLSGARRLSVIQTVDPNVKPPTVTLYYRMRAKDLNAGGVSYLYWVVPDEPDKTGALYNGPYAGGYKNFDISVIDEWTSLPVVG